MSFEIPLQEKRREWNREWHKANRTKSVERHRSYRAADPEKYRELNRQWRAKNTERRKLHTKKYRETNRERLRAQHRAWKGLPEPTRACPQNCELCGGSSGNRALHLDHCHKTGAFRGWLCSNCNRGIGHLKDDVSLLQKAIEYLKNGGIGCV